MQLETLLPLGKVDPGLRTPDTPLDMATVADNAQLLERLGYSGLVVEETKDDPFVIMAFGSPGNKNAPAGNGSRARLSAQPNGDSDECLDVAKAVERSLCTWPGNAGQRPYSTSFWHAVVCAGSVDA